MTTPDYVDAALFLGMHSTDERLRVACKSFFTARVDDRLIMSMEQIGRCDDTIWRLDRDLQDAYYPFMDTLHTVVDIHRPAYDEADVQRGLSNPLCRRFPTHERLLLGMVMRREGRLTSASPRLVRRRPACLPVHPPEPVTGPEPCFPEPIEQLYQKSLAVRLPREVL
ncbi:DUF6190 family protein [Pseudonocardia sp. NPDC046786]|uniref:DUF6190 family protein n=1 Tax=Pseudonocardia sp. NPDC046786 TaxID=3155471 RepID=UPI0033D9AF54